MVWIRCLDDPRLRLIHPRFNDGRSRPLKRPGRPSSPQSLCSMPRVHITTRHGFKISRQIQILDPQQQEQKCCMQQALAGCQFQTGGGDVGADQV